MGRWLYIVLLRLHPRAFRERFGEEMISIFEVDARSGARIALLVDAAFSLCRQRLLRPARHQPASSMAAPMTPSGVPVFHTLDSSLPRRSALVNGAILSLICLGLLNFANSRGGGKLPALLIGAKYPRSHVLPVNRASVSEAEPTTEVKVSAPAVDPVYQIADIYFKIIRVLEALDTDRDRIVSTPEIAIAASRLRRLDTDSNGNLSAEECGFFLGNNSKPDRRLEERTRLEFMRLNPVLATLDGDANGEISAEEISGSSVALRTLDRNADGNLSPAELLPDPVDNRTAMIMSRFDTNRDRKLSPEERATGEPEPLRELFERADRNRDGVTTAAELSVELQFRDELKQHIEKALRSISPINPRQQMIRPR